MIHCLRHYGSMEVGETHEKELYTWKYVNKKGDPDKRFKDNRKIPIVLYECTVFFVDN